MKRLLTISMLIALSSCSSLPELNMIQKPILFNPEREQLSIDYLRERHGIVTDSATIEPKMVVVHWTVIPTLDKTFDVFNPATLPNHRPNIASASALNVSAHFLIDRDGTIYQILPTTTFARHTIGLNHTAIGIENIADGESLPLTKQQILANIELINYLGQLHEIDYVIGHHEYQRFIGHELWKETDPNYLTEKSDPGDENMQLIRVGLKKLNLKSIP